jgi:L-2-amino-thiazoline-4-carboxylic acid hydrolase
MESKMSPNKLQGASGDPATHAGRSQDPAQFDLRKITTPILLHLLKSELRFPWLFLARCKLTVNRFKRTIDPRFPAELVEICALPLWVYINLKDELGQKKAFEIMRVAILTGGIAQWNFAYRAAEGDRTFEKLCDEELKVNQNGPTRWNTLEVVERTERRFEIKITRCLYHELTTAMGVPELTPVICQIDNAAFNSYLPDSVAFTRGGPGHRIADGAKECNFRWDFIG